MREDIKRVGEFCREFRITVLDLSLTKFAEMVGENLKNINAFEYGRANNIKYLIYYYKVSDPVQQTLFCRLLFRDVIE